MTQLAPDGTMNNVEELLARDLSPQEESPVTDTHRKRSKSKRGKGSKGGVGGVGGVRTTKVNFVPKSKEERKQASAWCYLIFVWVEQVELNRSSSAPIHAIRSLDPTHPVTTTTPSPPCLATTTLGA